MKMKRSTCSLLSQNHSMGHLKCQGVVKGKVVSLLNYVPCHEDIQGTGCKAPFLTSTVEGGN